MTGASRPDGGSPRSAGPVAWVHGVLRDAGIEPGAPWLAKFLALFVHPELAPDHSATRLVQRLFPHVDFNRPRLADAVRIPLQLLALLLVRFERPSPPLPGLAGSRRRHCAPRLRGILRRSLHALRVLKRRFDRSVASVGHGTQRSLAAAGDRRLWRLLWHTRPGRILVICGGLALVYLPATTPFDPTRQALFSAVLFAFAVILARVRGRPVTLLLIFISVLVSVRYLWWRVAYTINWDEPAALAWGGVLLAAECYAWLMLMLSYLQTAWPLSRKPVPLPASRAGWPTVDVYVPTYNEPITVVAPTVIAALAIDWPRDKLRVCLLDDGRREEMRQFAAEVGAEYVVRPDNRHAKAGNLNHAMGVTGGEYIAIFDCDHVPTSSFLTSVMGWFLRDDRLALVQTPHHFFSPDPFERNLRVHRHMPQEAALFHRLIQDGNDLWNSAFFCGSCAVLRRQALEEIGGFAVETVTEDAHTALRLQRRGWDTAHINIPLAAGLATENLTDHINQRIRWARGMTQIFRLDNPFFGPGLRLAQRLCYGSAMLHFFNGGPRLVFLTAPLAFLVFNVFLIRASPVEVMAYVLPHLLHSTMTSSRLYGHYRRTIWCDVYETVMAWYILLPTTLALINPRYGKFNVTPKGRVAERDQFDWFAARPCLVLAALNLLCLASGISRLGAASAGEFGTTLLNMVWTTFNLLILGAAIAVSSERKQRRRHHRAKLDVPVALQFADGRSRLGRTVDVSPAGAALSFQKQPDALPGDEVTVSFPQDDGGSSLAARVVAVTRHSLRLSWQPMSRRSEAALVQCSLASPGIWASRRHLHRRDRPTRGLAQVTATAGDGYRALTRSAYHLAAAPLEPALRDLRLAWLTCKAVLPRAPGPPAHRVPSAIAPVGQAGTASLPVPFLRVAAGAGAVHSPVSS